MYLKWRFKIPKKIKVPTFKNKLSATGYHQLRASITRADFYHVLLVYSIRNCIKVTYLPPVDQS